MAVVHVACVCEARDGDGLRLCSSWASWLTRPEGMRTERGPRDGARTGPG